MPAPHKIHELGVAQTGGLDERWHDLRRQAGRHRGVHQDFHIGESPLQADGTPWASSAGPAAAPADGPEHTSAVGHCVQVRVGYKRWLDPVNL